MSAAFDLMATVTASTKRPPAVSSGLRGAAVENLSTLACTPLDPVDAEVRQREELASFVELRQTHCRAGLDIERGDILVVSSSEYAIRAVEEWNWRMEGADTLRLIVEEIKN